MQSSEMPRQSFTIFPAPGSFFPTSAGKSWRKMMKGNKHMKTITHLKSPSRRQFPSLALLLATVTLLAFAPQSARASGEMPFHANFIAHFESVLEFPLLHVTVNAAGEATYMGRPSAYTDDQLVNLIDGSLTATYILTPASRMANGRVYRPGKRSPRLIRLSWLSLFPLAARSLWRGEFFSPVAIQSPEAPADSPALPAAAFLGGWASILPRPMVSARLPSRARSRCRAV